MSLSPNFVDLEVNLPAVGVSAQNFNVGLIIGPSTVISTGVRVKEYGSISEVLQDGFTVDSHEYIAATLYFAAASQPNLLCIGRKGSGETSLAALTACRAKSSTWYMAYDTTAIDSDQAANAAYIEALTSPLSQYFCQTSTAAVAAGTGGNIFETLKNGNYSRTHGLYSTQAHAVASIMGYAAGQASSAAGSAFTLKFKAMPGVTAEALTETQVSAIEGNRGNVYVNRGLDMYEQGKNFSNQFFDEVLGLDMLANDIQVAATNLLYGAESVPQDETGMSQFRTVIGQANETAVNRGFLAKERAWTGAPVLGLKTGQILPAGYYILSDPINGQSAADRANRLAPTIYDCINLAGSIHSVVIKLNVNR